MHVKVPKGHLNWSDILSLTLPGFRLEIRLRNGSGPEMKIVYRIRIILKMNFISGHIVELRLTIYSNIEHNMVTRAS